MLFLKRKILTCSLAFCAIGLVFEATAKSLSFIRDAEIENVVRSYSIPLFASAKLPSTSISVYIVNDPSLNAFVAGGNNIFVNTGLLSITENPNQLIGILAHETGHIAGGHLNRIHRELRKANAQMIASMVLGVAAAMSGRQETGAAIFGTGSQLSRRTLLKYSRAQESAADHAALKLLERTGQSAVGLAKILKKLANKELLIVKNTNPYVRSHPLSKDRINAVESHIGRSQYSKTLDSPSLQLAHDRMLAKLMGFLKKPMQTYRRYPPDDNSIPARYAHVFAYQKQNKITAALRKIRSLIADVPNDPYFWETKGALLQEMGQYRKSVTAHETAVNLRPRDMKLRTGLSKALVIEGSMRNIEKAIENLRVITAKAPKEYTAWRWLATAYGKKGNIGMAALATAERYIATNRHRDALQQALKAQKILPLGKPPNLRAQDIEHVARLGIKSE